MLQAKSKQIRFTSDDLEKSEHNIDRRHQSISVTDMVRCIDCKKHVFADTKCPAR